MQIGAGFKPDNHENTNRHDRHVIFAYQFFYWPSLPSTRVFNVIVNYFWLYTKRYALRNKNQKQAGK